MNQAVKHSENWLTNKYGSMTQCDYWRTVIVWTSLGISFFLNLVVPVHDTKMWLGQEVPAGTQSQILRSRPFWNKSVFRNAILEHVAVGSGNRLVSEADNESFKFGLGSISLFAYALWHSLLATKLFYWVLGCLIFWNHSLRSLLPRVLSRFFSAQASWVPGKWGKWT